MKRIAIAATWVWIALAEPAGAFALASHEPLSASPSHSMRSDDDAVTVITFTTPAMCDDASELTTLATLMTLATRAEYVAGMVGATDARERDADEQPAWCISADDPRCSPRDASSAPDVSRGQAPLPASAELSLPKAYALPAQRAPRPLQLAAARTGSHSRVERPPRSC
jgi:hypothetical protein